MFRKLFGPKHTFADTVRLLETGLRSGEIILREKPEEQSPLSPGTRTRNATEPQPEFGIRHQGQQI